MDPIHPIVPVVPDILPILPTTKSGRLDRESAREAPDRRRQDRRRAPAEDAPTDYPELPPGEDDGLGHVDLTA
jgi:hypothetical protein